MFAPRGVVAASRGQLARHATRAPRSACSLWTTAKKSAAPADADSNASASSNNNSPANSNGGSATTSSNSSTTSSTSSGSNSSNSSNGATTRTNTASNSYNNPFRPVRPPLRQARPRPPKPTQDASNAPEASSSPSDEAPPAKPPSGIDPAKSPEGPEIDNTKILFPRDDSAPRPTSFRSKTVDWDTNAFHGIATQPVTIEQYVELSKLLPIDDIEVKPDGVIYLPEIKYRRKLNEVFGPMGWGMIPKGDAVVTGNIVTREYALIIGGRFVSQSQGENQFFSSEQLPSAVEGCKSNALMRCCKDLGIASELWDPSFVRWFKQEHMEEMWVEHATTKKKRTLWFKKGQPKNVQYPWKSLKQ